MKKFLEEIFYIRTRNKIKHGIFFWLLLIMTLQDFANKMCTVRYQVLLAYIIFYFIILINVLAYKMCVYMRILPGIFYLSSRIYMHKLYF